MEQLKLNPVNTSSIGLAMMGPFSYSYSTESFGGGGGAVSRHNMMLSGMVKGIAQLPTRPGDANFPMILGKFG